ncbi:triose-phosphate isomerase [bacterium]|nr:triose-phosphate isomerase [bacterium]
MRTKLIAGNWKMNLTSGEAGPLAKTIADAVGSDGPDVLLCPSFTLIPAVRDAVDGTKVQVGAQNIFWEPKGAYTGEVSAEMLIDAGCSHVIIGHSERRQYFGETDASVQRKTMTALKVDLIPIICVGETLDEREEGRTEAIIDKQISGALTGIEADDMLRVVIAYEPVWAIGTGRTATPDTAQEVHKQIRTWLKNKYGKDVAEQVRILYGGSMKAANAADLLGQPDIDGGLVGGASLKADEFKAIIDAAR